MCLPSVSDLEYSHVTVTSTYYFLTDILGLTFYFCMCTHLHVCVLVACGCVCGVCACSDCGGQKGALDLQELELWMVKG